MTPEVERKLLDYLAEGRSDRLTFKETLTTHAKASQRLLHQFELHESKDEARHNEVKHMIAGINARLDRVEKDAEDTGRFQIDELKERLKQHQQQAIDWKKWAIRTAIGLAIAAGSGAIGMLASQATAEVHHESR